ncbi:hypothetical protein [Thiocystis minor]|uniref:hypothetical protein n=1 Tax=Thiocystis minor TaxID=61597 RepID=UPI0019116886|nr:hypothetical protein [Thiocystis minor]
MSDEVLVRFDGVIQEMLAKPQEIALVRLARLRQRASRRRHDGAGELWPECDPRASNARAFTSGPQAAHFARQLSSIRKNLEQHFGPNSQIRLFESRTDDDAKGRDIERDIDSPDQIVEVRLHALVELQLTLGDQKTDLVIHHAQGAVGHVTQKRTLGRQ